MSDESRDRIENLEAVTRRVVADLAEVRRELQALRAAVAPDSMPVSPTASTLATPSASSSPPAVLPATPRAGVGAHPVPLPPPPSTGAVAGARAFIQRVLDPPRDPAAAPPPGRTFRAPQPPGAGILPAGMSFEDLVGRYGAMALAALAIMSGIGIFLSWAIAQNLIGPAIRVGAGFAAAAALGALGWRLRSRNARTFGNTLMGIGLAVTHVVAWGAGPGLGVMPNSVALAIAAAASVALAVLAWRSGEESLFVVGVGGALVAPFVTTPGRGDGEALLVFGWLVLTTALWGMRTRPWQSARFLLGTAGVAYATAAMTAAWSAEGAFAAELPSIFAVACAWGALVLGGPLHAAALASAYLIGGIGPLFYDYDADGVLVPHVIIGAVATITLFVSVVRHEEGREGWLLTTVLIPVVYLLAAITPLDDAFSPTGATIALGWAVAAGVFGTLVLERRREVLWVVGVIASTTALVLLLSENEIAMIAALSALVASVSFILQRERAPLLTWSLLPAIVIAAGALWIQFDLRPPYAYTPFATSASLGALALVLGLGVLGWNVAHTGWRRTLTARERGVMNGLGVTAAFIWGHVELSEAFSPDLATFLLIGYYAATGVAAIFVGRRDGLSDLRRVGLALAIFAALKAVAQGYELEQIGLRVGTFLLVGGFLLAVAYWYRAAGEAVAEAREARGEGLASGADPREVPDPRVG